MLYILYFVFGTPFIPYFSTVILIQIKRCEFLSLNKMRNIRLPVDVYRSTRGSLTVNPLVTSGVRTHGDSREVDERVLADHHLLDQFAVTELHQLRVVEGGGDLPTCTPQIIS